MMSAQLALVAVAVFCLLGCSGGGEADGIDPEAAAAAGQAPEAEADPTAPPPGPTITTGALRFLALGDSYTKGTGIPAGEGWPAQLAVRLRAAGLDVADPLVIAETGWRTDDLDRGINAVNPAGPFDLVTLLIGVNNQYQGRSAGQYRVEFDALLRRAIGFAGGEPSRVVVLSIPDYGATPYGQANDPATIAAAVDQFNEINRALSQRAGVRYVDVAPVSKSALADPTLTAQDELHPSGLMYAAWVELALPEAQAALQRVTATTTTSPAAPVE